jgi:hypothetical protein
MSWRALAIVVAALIVLALVVVVAMKVSRSSQDVLARHVLHVRSAFAEVARSTGLRMIDAPAELPIAFPRLAGEIRGMSVDVSVDQSDDIAYGIAIVVRGASVDASALDRVRARCVRLDAGDREVRCVVRPSGVVTVEGGEISRIVPEDLAAIVDQLARAS